MGGIKTRARKSDYARMDLQALARETDQIILGVIGFLARRVETEGSIGMYEIGLATERYLAPARVKLAESMRRARDLDELMAGR